MLNEKLRSRVAYIIYAFIIIIELVVGITTLVPLYYVSNGLILGATLLSASISVLVYFVVIYVVNPKADNKTKQKYVVFSIIAFCIFYLIVLYKQIAIKEYTQSVFALADYITVVMNGHMTLGGLFYYCILYLMQLAPLGVILPIVFKKMENTVWFIVAVLILSFVLELIKFILQISLIGIDKMILSVLGAWLIYFIFKKYVFPYSVLHQENYLPFI